MKLKGESVFTYQVNSLTPVTMLLRPRRQEGQAVYKEGFTIEPSVLFNEFTDFYGNHCQRAILPEGEVIIATEVEAEVIEYRPLSDPKPAYVPVEDLPSETMIYLLASRYCQSDLPEIQQLALDIVGDFVPGYAQVEAIRQWIHLNVEYRYGVTNSTSTAIDLVHHRVGVCRDFSHLAISLCRSLCIPTRMTVGYLDKLKYADLHAWFEVYLGNQWYPFDAVQEETHGGRIVLGYGRDAADVAMITQFGDATLQSLVVRTEVIAE